VFEKITQTHTMAATNKLKSYLQNGQNIYVPSVSVDCVIFGFHENQLKVLLLKMKDIEQRLLPGGFIEKNENTDEAATRVLNERTGLGEIFLQQFHVFGEPDRSDKKFHAQRMKKEGFVPDKNHWLLQRFITIGYYALVEFSTVNPMPDDLSDSCTWYDLHNLPTLMIDHTAILQKALETVRQHISYHRVGYNLLPVKFTMPELQKLYETILDRQLDRRNFQRKIMVYGILKKLKEVKKGVAHKAPFLYVFDLKKYNKALKDGLC
jgi:8-oxo-dGTP diphosphatase